MRSGLLSQLKAIAVPRGSRLRTIQFGLYKGLKLEIDLTNQTQIYLGLSEQETNSAIRRAASRAQWLVDVGAAKGELSLYFANLSSVHTIVAAEPNLAEAAEMKTNMRNNEIAPSRIRLIEKFVGTGDPSTHVRLDDLALSKKQRGFIKIDVDGFEMDVLRSGHDLLSNGNVDVLVETHSAALEQECLHYLRDLAFPCVIIDNAWWRALLPEQRPSEQCRWIFCEGQGDGQTL